jgi:hypothetical protein
VLFYELAMLYGGDPLKWVGASEPNAWAYATVFIEFPPLRIPRC